MNRYCAAVVQMDSQDDRRCNLHKIEQYTAGAASAGAQLVVFPETVDYIGVDMRSNAWNQEEAEKFFGELAAGYGIYVHCGSVTVNAESGRTCNRTMLFAPDGRCMGSYDKLHMFDIEAGQGASYKESSQICAGESIAGAKTELGTLGLAICYDIRFGEMFRLLALAGAQVLCVCANFTAPTGKEHWEPLLRARAIENGCYVLAANQTGSKPAFEAYGNSMIIDPWGKVIARSSNREEIIYVTVDLDYVNQIRRQIPSLSNRREDIYQLKGRVDIWE